MRSICWLRAKRVADRGGRDTNVFEYSIASEGPKPKAQSPNKLQSSKLKKQNIADAALEIEALKVAWDLVIGIWDFTVPTGGRRP